MKLSKQNNYCFIFQKLFKKIKQSLEPGLRDNKIISGIYKKKESIINRYGFFLNFERNINNSKMSA
jgi:hypothetical protein